ncbi:hypothetical protein CsSME_00033407 [Camellia sinensis var. sinensis]
MCYNVDNCRSRCEDRATVCESSMASIDSPKWTSLRDLGMCLIDDYVYEWFILWIYEMWDSFTTPLL